jgi:AmpD protein
VQQFFQNRLDPNEHPYFTSISHLTVSAHLFVERDGAVTQFVSLLDRAWHAGVSCFNGREGCNDFSIGIELEGTDDLPYTDSQYAVLEQLTRQIQAAWPVIDFERIQGHSDIAPVRKTDPGPAFDWARYRKALSGNEDCA